MKIAVVYTATTPELTAGIADELRKNPACITGVDIEIASYQNAAILQEARDAGGLTPNCARELMDLYEQEVDEGADCILNVCSSVGKVAKLAKPLYRLSGTAFILRSMLGVTILTPADAGQAAAAMFDVKGPVYLRLGSGREPEVFPEDTPFALGKIREVKRYGDDVTIFASGFIMNRAIAALEALRDEGVNATLVDVPTVKPLASRDVAAVLKRTGCAVAVEDHNCFGGLSSAICEVACHFHPCRVIRLGLRNEYPRSGHADKLLDAYGLAVADIVAGAKRAISGAE